MAKSERQRARKTALRGKDCGISGGGFPVSFSGVKVRIRIDTSHV